MLNETVCLSTDHAIAFSRPRFESQFVGGGEGLSGKVDPFTSVGCSVIDNKGNHRLATTALQLMLRRDTGSVGQEVKVPAWEDSLACASIQRCCCFWQEAICEVLIEPHRKVRHVLHETRHATHLIEDCQDVVPELH